MKCAESLKPLMLAVVRMSWANRVRGILYAVVLARARDTA